MLINTPLVFVFHLIMTGLLFAILPSLNVFIGYAYVGSVSNVNPGTLIDVLIYLRNPNFTRPILILLFVGLIIALMYYFVTLTYYHKGAVGLLIPNQKEVLVEELVDAIGGLKNIKLMNASVSKVIIQVNDRNKVDFKKIHHRVHKIVDTKAGYALSYGSSSYMIYVDITNRLKEVLKSA
jgi:phosphotransferase system IIB component